MIEAMLLVRTYYFLFNGGVIGHVWVTDTAKPINNTTTKTVLSRYVGGILTRYPNATSMRLLLDDEVNNYDN